MSRKRGLSERNWNRYLWLELRHHERSYAWHDRWLRKERHSCSSQTQSHAAMLASTGKLMLTVARSHAQCRRFLGL